MRIPSPSGDDAGPRIIGAMMAHFYRILKSPDNGEIVDSIRALEAFARKHGPGRYHVDEYSLDPFPGSNATARIWGKIIHQENGEIVLDPIDWSDAQEGKAGV
jgi:hypothetical protein